MASGENGRAARSAARSGLIVLRGVGCRGSDMSLRVASAASCLNDATESWEVRVLAVVDA